LGYPGTYTAGTAKTTTGGSGTGCINILTVGVTGRVTTITSNSISLLDNITLYGMTESAWNGVFQIVVWSQIPFNVAMNVTTNAIFSINTSTTVLVDATASWDVNEYGSTASSAPNQLVQ
jgi:hypothetical protein